VCFALAPPPTPHAFRRDGVAYNEELLQ